MRHVVRVTELRVDNDHESEAIHRGADHRGAEAGAKTKELCRKYGISEPTFYNWKAKYTGMTVADVRRLKELESESSKLKKLLAELELELEFDKTALKDLLGRKW